MAKPVGVTIKRPDGRTVVCDDFMRHDGVDAEGIDHWSVVYAGFRPGVDRLSCEMLPGRTSIGILIPEARIPPGAKVSATWEDWRSGEVTKYSKDFDADGGDCTIYSSDNPVGG